LRGTSTSFDFKSCLIFSITSNATLFSKSSTSRSQNNSSNCDAEIFFVVTASLTFAKNPFFSSSLTSFFLGAAFFSSLGIGVFSATFCSFFFSAVFFSSLTIFFSSRISCASS